MLYTEGVVRLTYIVSSPAPNRPLAHEYLRGEHRRPCHVQLDGTSKVALHTANWYIVNENN